MEEIKKCKENSDDLVELVGGNPHPGSKLCLRGEQGPMLRSRMDFVWPGLLKLALNWIILCICKHSSNYYTVELHKKLVEFA